MPKNPKANFVKRVHQTLRNMLRTAELYQHKRNPSDPFTGILANCAWAIRSSVHVITRRIPAQLVFGRDMLFDVSFLTNWNKIIASKSKASTQNNERVNTKRVKYIYKPGNNFYYPTDN